MCAARPHITHVAFDMDGLLLDTETFYTIAQQQVVGKFGKEFTWELKAKAMGKKAMESAVIIIEGLGLEGQLTPEEFIASREAILDELFPTAQLMPGVDKLVRHLKAHGVPIAVATSSHRRHFDIKTTQHRQFFQLFDHIITGDMVSHGKPAPDIFLAAAAKWEPPAAPASVLVFEDAPSGVDAALAAGMAVVMVPDDRLDRALCAHASQVVGSLEEFLPQEWGLPAY